jgi:hypothetical protein
MSVSSAVPVVVGALIGAGGAVAAQIVASIFTAHREDRRLNWEQERQDRDWKIRGAERFLSVKQDIYSRYIHLANQFVLYADRLRKERVEDDSAEAEPLEWDELSRLRWNIVLLGSPPVQEYVKKSYDRIFSAVRAAEQSKSREGRLKTVRAARIAQREVTEAMRADLLDDQEAIQSRHTDEPVKQELQPDLPLGE